MDYEAEFLLSIPMFLRRLEAPGRGGKPSTRQHPAGANCAFPREKPVTRQSFPASRGAGPSPEPARPPTRAQPPVEEARKATPVAPVAIDDPAIVSIDDHRSALSRNLGPVQTEPPSAAAEDRDAAFQVTLPRSVIQQIRLLAAQEGTTHRAIILRSLRIAGLSIPEGADVDRRALAARRREQARKTAPDRDPRQVSPQPRHAQG